MLLIWSHSCLFFSPPMLSLVPMQKDRDSFTFCINSPDLPGKFHFNLMRSFCSRINWSALISLRKVPSPPFFAAQDQSECSMKTRLFLFYFFSGFSLLAVFRPKEISTILIKLVKAQGTML